MATQGWPSPLSWDQFEKRDERPEGAPADAHIEGRYANPPGRPFQFVRRGRILRIESVTFVMTVASGQTWVVDGRQTDRLLNHELGHWNIVGLIAREHEEHLVALRGRSSREMQRRMDRLQRQMIRKSRRVNRAYDDDTEHSIKQAEQERWDEVIRNCMQSAQNLP